MSMTRTFHLFYAMLGLALIALFTPHISVAVDAPHVNTCITCHNSSMPTDTILFNSNCLSCHEDFNSGTNSVANRNSHKWEGSVANPAAGAQQPTIGALVQVQDYTGSQLACVNCHNPHVNAPANNYKYRRIANDMDQLCVDCHRSRNVLTAATGSHPVFVGYSSAAKAAPDKFVGTAPVNANPANPTSDLGAYLSADNKLLCSTCHRVHSADSRSSNYVNGFKNYSTGDGNILRTNPRGAKVAGGVQDNVNLCTNCHAGKKNHNGMGQDVQCLDCHSAHVDYDPQDPTGSQGINIDLIRRNVTKYGSPSRILFRYGGDNREYKNADGTGVCQGCHDIPNTIADHASNDPNVCNKCHSHDNATSSFSASMPDHKAMLGSGDIVVFTGDSTHDVTPLSMTENCTLCHYESLVQQHGGNCSLCHSGSNPPANALIGNWNKTCQQASCHPSLHSAMKADHNGIYWNSSSSCDLCHDTSTVFPNPADNCTRCHNPDQTVSAVGDHQPPTTTSNAQSSYVGNATIHLSAADTGSGVAFTFFYNENHGRFEIGNNVYYSAPTSGSRSHTLKFYSIDNAMNIEALKSVTFTVSAFADTTPPVTTSSFNPATNAIFKASQAVSLSASDSGSGVKATYYRIEAGAFVQGTAFTVSGDGLHSFSYYSVDNANNTESSHVSNTFRIDTIAPVTTNSAVSGTTYTGSQIFNLSAADSGSGVAGTWYKVDSGAFTSGTSIAVSAPASGSASHTIAWYSIDNAGNQETTKSVTFSVAAVVADTTPPVTTSSFNPAANAIFKASQPVTIAAGDSGSGVKATYYRIDAGAFVQGTAFSVSGDGLHSFSYYSVDNANNTESAHVSNTFRIDTVAPVTTNSAVSGTTYTGSQTFTLSAADSGSGVAGTWYKLDSGSFTAGTSIAVAAPSSGSASHTISWYSIDNAGNQEATKTLTFTVQAAAAGGGTITLSFRTNASFGGWSYVLWEVHDAAGNLVNDVNGNPCSWWNDDPAHPSSMSIDYKVPAGVAYTMYGAWGPMPDGPDEDTGTRSVSISEAAPGATITWWWY
jgi:predicted CXXCH cytochrome family protein